MLSENEISALLLSLRVAVVSTAITMPAGLLVAWLLAKSRMPGKSLLDTLVSLPLVMPPVVTGFLMLLLLGRNGFIGSFLYDAFGVRIVFTWFAAALASAVVSFPLLVRAVTVAMGGVDDRLEAAARSLGAGRLRTFFTITLPLARRGVLAGAVLAFSRSLGEFGATIIVAGNIPGKTQTMPLAVFNYWELGKYGEAGTLLVVATAVAFIAMFAVWFLTGRGQSSGVKRK